MEGDRNLTFDVRNCRVTAVGGAQCGGIAMVTLAAKPQATVQWNFKVYGHPQGCPVNMFL